MACMKGMIAPAITACLLLGSCDEGRIFGSQDIETRGGTPARLTATATGADEWPEGYSVALAGFADGNEYALISKNIDTREDGLTDMILSDIPDGTSTVELCVIDRLRRRVATFASAAFTREDTVMIHAGDVDVSPAAAIQKEILNTSCAQCHGGAGHAAASLDLTAGMSFQSLVGIPSVKEEGTLRVKPGDSSASLLYRFLSTTESATWNYDHSVEVVAPEKLELIRDWIDAGAKY